jgi:predicted O-methyltransferase YrrM
MATTHAATRRAADDRLKVLTKGWNRLRSIAGRFSNRRPAAIDGPSHGEMIELLITRHRDSMPEHPTFVEAGCGISSVSLAKMAREMGATSYSLDYNPEKIEDLKARAGDKLEGVTFIVGDSLRGLTEIVQRHGTLDFVFLDSSPSAMHGLREFHVIEPALRPGAVLLVDNAAIPGTDPALVRTPCRKGKILVPYLLASPYWEVSGHPEAGDSMISAVLHADPAYADPAYEDPGYVDNWRPLFDARLVG